MNTVETSMAEGILSVELTNPGKRNALDAATVAALHDSLDAADGDPSVRVVVLRGRGPVFCAGADLSSVGSLPIPASGSRLAVDTGSAPSPRGFASLMHRMMRSEKPIVSIVGGSALGGGVGLCAASTFAIASRDATFQLPELKVGLFPMIILAVLARVVPRRQLVSLMLTCEKILAEDAAKLGIVGKVVNSDALETEGMELARTLASQSPTAIRLGLRAMGDQEGRKLEDALGMLEGRLVECLQTEDAREGITAFLSKRAPQWTGR
jgi:enoyl-CoA hydratase/carnithine racemase